MKKYSFLVLTLLALFATQFLFGQAETGSIVGTVTDVTGAVIRDAKVTVTSTTTGAIRNASSNDEGLYTITNLQPGLYEVKIVATGFATYAQNVQVAVGSRVGLNPKLKAGATSTTVEVTASGEAVRVNTENQTIGQVVDEKSVSELPTLTRDYTALAATSGSVSSDPGGSTGRGVGLSINGARAASTSVLLDGGENMDYFGAGVGQDVPLDSIQEFSILTNNFTPEFGRASGGVVNVATKQGSNAFHGSAYEFYRGSGLGANTPENKANGLKRNRYDRNQFGYSIGGPIIKNKLFFFNNVEWIRVRSAASVQYLVPTADFIAQAAPVTQQFMAAHGANLVAPIDRVFTKDELTQAGSGLTAGSAGTPWGDLPGTFPVLGQVTASVPTDAGGGSPSNQLLGVARLDWNISDKSQLFARWGAQRQNFFAGSNSDSAYAGYNTGTINRNNNYALSFVRVFSPNFVSQTKAVYNRLKNLQPVNGEDTPSMYWKGTYGTTILGRPTVLPGYYPMYPGSGIPFGGPQNLYQIYQDINWTKGHHQFRFGGNYIHMRDNRQFGAYEMANEQLGTNPASGFNQFLLGRLVNFRTAVYPQGKNACPYDYVNNTYVTSVGCTIVAPATTPKFGRNNRYNDYAFYFNDTWKIHERLSLNLGIRYEVYGVQHNSDPKLDANFYYGQGANFPEQYRNGVTMIADQSPVGGLWAPDRNNWGPRVGFAYDPTGKGKTSIRGGFGIFFERNFGNVTFNVIQNPPNYAVPSLTPTDMPGGVLPVYVANLGPFAETGVNKALIAPSVRNVDEHIRTAYTETWNFGIQHNLRADTLLEVNYTGSHGLKLYSLEDYNRRGSGVIYNGDDPEACPTCYANRMNMQYGVGSYNRGNRGMSNYQGVNFKLQSTNIAKTGFSYVLNYTWSHALDNLSSTFSDSNYNYNTGLLDPFNPGLDYGNADFDVRHRFVLSGTYAPPYGLKSSNALVKYALAGWELAPMIRFNTGTPFTLFDCNNGYYYCPRAQVTGPESKLTRGTAVEGVGNEYYWIAQPIVNAANTYYNPLTGNADIGNCTVPGEGASAPCPWPTNMLHRNTFRTPNNVNFDMGIYKNIPVTERVKLQVRGELYNVFNHANNYINGGTIDVSASTDNSGNIGLVTVKKYDQRNVQLALKIIF